MSFSRLNYDDCAYKQALKESVRPGDYRVNVPFNFKKNVYAPQLLFVYKDRQLDKKSFAVDADSELLGITRKNSKCPKLLVPCSDKLQYGLSCGDSLEHGVDGFMPADDTRLSNPASNLRGTGYNRWEYLCLNPQAHVEMPFDNNINNRIVSKDNHRPCIPKPLNQKLVWPKQ